MVCPNTTDAVYKNQVEHIGDLKSFILFNLNELSTPDLSKTSAYKSLLNSYGETGALLGAYDAFIKNKKLSTKKSKKKEPIMKLMDFPFSEGGFLKKDSVTKSFEALVKRLDMTINDSGSSIYLTMADGKVFFPSSLTPISSFEAAAQQKAVIKREKAWIKERLGNNFPVEIAHHLVLGKAWGRFSRVGIELYEAAPAGTGYHEAFHAVFNLGLNHGEREVLFAEVKGRKGNENKTRLELEEIMADEFSDYVISGGKLNIPEVQKGFFARILNALKALFKTNISAEELYKGIEEGRFSELVTDAASIQDIPNKFKVVDHKFPMVENGKTVLGNLSEKQTFDLMEGLSNNLFQMMFTSDDPDSFFDKSKRGMDKIYNLLRVNMLKDAKDHLRTITDKTEKKKLGTLYMGTLGLNNKLEISEDPKHKKYWDAVVMHHMTIALPQFGMVAKGIDKAAAAKYLGTEAIEGLETEELDENTNTRDKAFNKASIEFDTKDGIPRSMKAILLGIGQKTKQGKQLSITPSDKNSLGFNKMVPMGKIYAMFANELHGSAGSYTEMKGALKRLSKESSDFGFAAQEMLNRLGGDKEVSIIEDIDAIEDLEDRIAANRENIRAKGLHRLRTQFVQAFSKTKYNFDIQLMDATGRLYTSDANMESLRGTIKADASAMFRTYAAQDINKDFYIPKEVIDARVTEIIGSGDSQYRSEAIQEFAELVGITLRPKDYYTLATSMFDTGEKVAVEIGDEGTVLQDNMVSFASLLADALKSTEPYEIIVDSEGNEVEGIRDPFGRDGKINRIMNILIDFKASTSSDTTENSHINPEGKRVFGITLHSSMTITESLMNSVKGDVEGMKNKMPWLYNAYSNNSLMRNDVERGKKIKIGILEGISSVEDSSGLPTKALSPTDRYRQHIHAVMQGKYPFMRTADRSIENYITTGRLLISNVTDGVDVFRDYFMDEWNAIKDFKNGVGKTIKHYGTESKDKKGNIIPPKASQYRFFGDFMKSLDPRVQDKINNAKSIESFFANEIEMRELFDTKLLEYFNKEAALEEKYLGEVGLETKDLGDEVANYGEDLMLLYTMNSVAGNIEQTKLILGDPALYKSIPEIFKRASVYNGTKKVSRTGEDYNEAANQAIPKTAMVNGKEVTFPYTDTFKTIVVKDIESSVENKEMLIDILTPKFGKAKAKKIAEGFEGYEEADAQGYVSLNAYREIMDRAGDWSASHERVFQKLKDNPDAQISAREMTDFHPLKTQYAGPVANYSGKANVTTVHKHSLFPLIPAVIKNNPLLTDLEKYMTQNNVSIVEMGSANKFGTVIDENQNMAELVTKDGTFGLTSESPVMENYHQYFGIQLDILGDSKTKVGIGTQMTKELGANSFEFGDLQAGRNPEFKKKIEEYHDAYRSLIEYNTNKTMDAMGISAAKSASPLEPAGFKIEDFEKFRSYLKKMVDLKNADNNILDGIESFSEGDYIEFLPNYQSLESVLTSIVNNKIISSKVPGSAKVQVASTGFEVEINKDAVKTGKYKSDRLQYYRNDNGAVTGMQVLLPHYFKEIAEDMGITDITDPRLKEIIGFRIPTQAPSSLELIEIAGFLPRSAGDMIVVPSEHVAKGGSDFDIDKLNIYLPAYHMKDGKPEYITQDYKDGDKDFTKEKMHNRLLEAQIAIMKDPDYLADVATPIDSENLKNWRDNINELRKTNDMFEDSRDETMSEVFMPRTNLKKFRDYLAGQAGVGQTALHVVHHSLGQLVNLQAKAEDVFLKHGSNGHFYDHHRDEITGNVKLGGVRDVSGNYVIKDMISEFLNAYVDIAKDPYIFALNAGTQVANTIFYMLRSGASPEFVMHFVTQPSIVEYVKQTAIQESKYYNQAKPHKEKSQIVQEILSKFGEDSSNLLSEEPTAAAILKHNKAYKSGKFSLENLQKELKGANTGSTQKMILDQFLLYTSYARKLGTAIKASGVDTTGMGKNLNKGQEMLDLHNDVVSDGFIVNHSKLFSNTFLGAMQDAIRNYSGVYSKISITKHPRVKNTLDSFKAEVRRNVTGAEAKESAVKAVDNDLIAYYIQTSAQAMGESINGPLVDMIRPHHKKLYEYLTKSPRFAKNEFIKSLKLDTKIGRNMEDIFKLVDRKLNAGEKNVIISDFEQLFNQDIDLKEAIDVEGHPKYNLGDLLSIMTLYNNGVGKSRHGYSDTIPTYMFKAIMNRLVTEDKLTMDSLKTFKEQFYRNRPNYAALVPNGTKYDKTRSVQSLTISANSPKSKSSVLVKMVKDAKTSKPTPILFFRKGDQRNEEGESTGRVRFVAYGFKGIMGNGATRVEYKADPEFNTYNIIDLSYLSEEDAKEVKRKCEN